MTLHFSHIAMGTRFEMWLCGEDTSHLQSVAFLAWAEVDRLELMLSRHDSRAEIARVNREAAHRPTRVEVELFTILQDCQEWSRLTHGYFDVAYQSGDTSSHYILDPTQRTISFSHEGMQLDLGGYGKGYALDRVADLLRKYGVTSACLHGGRSSVLALGTREDGSHWMVDIPHYKDRGTVVCSQSLINQSFSYSATVSEDGTEQDIIAPHQKTTVLEPAACWALSSSALYAEVWTTALLAMGRTEAQKSFKAKPADITHIGWIE